MATEVILPKVDMDMSSGQISRWFHREGDVVRKGDPLFEIETDKAAMEVEAPASGTLRDVTAAEGVDIAVGAAVGWIYAEGEEPKKRPAEPVREEAQTTAAPAAGDFGVAANGIGTAGNGSQPRPREDVHAEKAPGERRPVRATPLARRLARERGVDLSGLAGRGPSGRIQREDVEAASEDRAPARRPTRDVSPLGKTARPAPIPAQSAFTPNTREAPLNAVRLREGSRTPIVLIHGFGAEIAGWRPFLPEMPDETPVIGIDLAGHGGSLGVAAESIAELSEQAEETLVAQGVTAAHLVGHSLGGAVAATVASGIAVETRSLLLLAPAGLGPEIDAGFVESFARATDEGAIRRWLEHLVADASALSDGFIKATARGRADGRYGAPQSALAGRLFSGGTQLFETRRLLGGLSMPVKVVMGSDDRVIPSRHGFGLPGQIALHVFAKTGHLPQIERRAEVGRLLRELVR